MTKPWPSAGEPVSVINLAVLARGARRFVSGLLFCATNPDGLAMCTETPFARFSVMLIGYMRVSSSDDRQVVDLQLDALLAAGVDERHLHQDKHSGGHDDRVGLKTCLAGLRAGDVLVVWKLDRLGRSLSHLVRILDDLKGRGVAFRSLTEGIEHHDPAWRVPLQSVRHPGPIRAIPDPRARECRAGRGATARTQRR